MNKNLMLKAIKIAIGSSIAMIIAECLGLQYATTAGVITLLTIRNTKKATLDVAVKRLLSFTVSIAVMVVTMYLIKNQSVGFGVFMLCLVVFSYYFKWEDSISVNAVIGTHIFLIEANITPQFIFNEFALLIVGTGVAIIVNLYMLDNIHEIKKDTLYIEKQLQQILISIAEHLKNKEGNSYRQITADDKEHINSLIVYIDNSLDKAFENMSNTSHDLAKYYIEYLNMRKSQCVVLIHFHRAVVGIETSCKEMDEVAEIILEIGQAIHKTVGIRKIIAELEDVISHLKLERLPSTTDEFISKAQVFYILEELEELLRLKRQFLLSLTEDEIRKYWG